MGSRRDCTWILGLAGFRVVTARADGETADSRVTIRIERRGARRYPCSGCGRRTRRVRSARDRTWDDLPWAAHPVTLVYAQRRVRCRHCGIRTERVEFAEPKARVTRRLRQQIGVDCQSMPTSHAAVRHGVSWGKARRAEHAFLREWDAQRPRRRPRYLGADEIHRGKAQKFYTVLSDLVHGEVIGLAKDRTEESLTGLLTTCLDARQTGRRRGGLHGHASALRQRRRPASCRRPRSCSTSSTCCSTPAPRSTTCGARSSFAPAAVMRAFGRGKRWLLLAPVEDGARIEARERCRHLFAANRRLFKAYVLREQLDRLWTYKTRDGVAQFLFGWLKALRWQRLPEMEKLGDTLVKHYRRHRRLLRPSRPLRRRRVAEHDHQSGPPTCAWHAR